MAHLQAGGPPLAAAGAPMELVTSTDLHARTRETLERVQAGGCIAITRYNAVEGYLVPPGQLDTLRERVAELEAREQELVNTLPLVLAAAQAGVAIPSETLRRLVPGLDGSWQAIATFAATTPVRIAYGEDGEAVSHGRLRAISGLVGESDDDDLNLDA
jgi:antitoxin (DNA-binding transcriptional repressor) of toxin-antitoxin stability system